MRIVERRYNNPGVPGLSRGSVWPALLLWLAAVHVTGVRAQTPRFDKDIAPILRDHCVKCHGVETRKGGLDLRTVASITQGGDTGEAIVPGKSGESLVIEQVASGKMPPGKNRKLTGDEIGVLRQWIDAGAPGQSGATKPAESSFWAFQFPRPPVPNVAIRASPERRRPLSTRPAGEERFDFLA